MAGIDWQWVLVAGNGRKWLEMAGNGLYSWKWLEWLDWLKMAGMAGNGWKLLNIFRNGYKCCLGVSFIQLDYPIQLQEFGTDCFPLFCTQLDFFELTYWEFEWLMRFQGVI